MHPEVVKRGPGTCDECGMDLVPTTSLGYAGKAPSQREAPLLIPASAPLITGKRAVVYVEVPDSEGPLFEGREIELGPRAGDFYVVRSGIQEGDLVVTNGAFKIDSELQIQAKPSMMLPYGGGGSMPHDHQGGAASVGEHLDAVRAITPVYEAYFELQMALAGDDHERARELAGELGARIGKVNMTLFSPTGHTVWMKLSRRLLDEASRLGNAKDLASARDAFYGLAGAIIEIEASFGHVDDRDYFLVFCPMVRNNQGATWLQDVDTIFNPFYGASMLRCGEIKDSLPSISEARNE
jgi:Cu(I)/Ag(I) efflux system membrane fusion protein